MILYHISKYKLGNFVSDRKICCAPTISGCVLGLVDLKRYKNSDMNRYSPIYIYKCITKKYKNGTEYDASATREKIVAPGVKFTFIGFFNIETAKHFDKLMYVLLEGHSIISDSFDKTRFYNMIKKIIALETNHYSKANLLLPRK